MVNHHMLSYSRTSVKQQTTTFILESLIKFEIYRYQCQRADARRIDQTLSDLDFGTFKLNLATARLELSKLDVECDLEYRRNPETNGEVSCHNSQLHALCGLRRSRELERWAISIWSGILDSSLDERIFTSTSRWSTLTVIKVR